MGYGLIQITGSKMQLLQMGSLQLHKYNDHALKLEKIFHRVLNLIDEYHPDELAIEAQFFGKNVQSMLKLGRAQGVAIAAALYRQIPYVEYPPKKIKQAITGNGNASKEQVAAMLKSILHLPDAPANLDETDGLAAAVCHYFQKGISHGQKSHSGWDAFLKNNPTRKVK